MEPSSDPALEALLRDGLSELGLPTDVAPRLADLAQRVAHWAEHTNLTAHRSPEAVARRLVLDALALGVALPVQPATLVDLGSGAGFPALPLAILWPACQITLVESRERKHHFQRTAIRALGLTNAHALRGRAESLDATPHEVAVAQAMAEPAQVLEWMCRWVAPAGWLALAQSDPPAEFAPPAGVRHDGVRRYLVPLGGPSRTLWLGHPNS